MFAKNVAERGYSDVGLIAIGEAGKRCGESDAGDRYPAESNGNA
jgi:hypothetical protein